MRSWAADDNFARGELEAWLVTARKAFGSCEDNGKKDWV